MKHASLQQKLAAAAESETAVWTPECVEPDDLIALIEQGANTSASLAQMAHVVSCAHCRREFDEMEQTLRLAARARDVQTRALTPVSTSPGVSAAEPRPEPRSAAPSFWRWLLGPSAGFALGAAAAALILFIVSVIPLQTKTAALQSQLTEQSTQQKDVEARIAAAQAAAQKEAEARLAQANESASQARKENEELKRKVAESAAQIAALEKKKVYLAVRPSDDPLALKTLQKAAALTENAMAVLTETQRSMGSSGAEKSPVHLLSPVAHVLLSERVPFRWESREGASGYTVVVLDADSRQVAKSGPLKGAEWVASLPAAANKDALSYYEWYVIVHHAGGEDDRTPSAKFAVLNTERLVEDVKAK